MRSRSAENGGLTKVAFHEDDEFVGSCYADDDDNGRRKPFRCTRHKLAAAAAAVALLIAMLALITCSVGDRHTRGKLRDRGPHTHRTIRQRIIEDGDPGSSSLASSYVQDLSDLPQCKRSSLERERVKAKFGCREVDAMINMGGELIGEGYWREVRKVQYEGKDFALKTLKESQQPTKKNKRRHRFEAIALQQVQDHPNIVGLVGLCDCDVVTEFYPRYLDEILFTTEGQEKYHFTTREILTMALQAGEGLRALHEVDGGPIVHSDLQPRQILLDDNMVLKVNDLNRLRFMGTRVDTGGPCPFTIGTANGVWRAPEEYAAEQLSEKLDVYSMGLIYWSMLGRRKPFEREGWYKQQVLRGERPEVDRSWHKGFVELFQSMWQDDPKARPSMGEVVARLEEMLRNLPVDE